MRYLKLILFGMCIKSLQGELWGWTCFYIGVAAVAFGSSYYHLKPNDARLVWDRLPVGHLSTKCTCKLLFIKFSVCLFLTPHLLLLQMTLAFTSIIGIFIIERIDERKGTLSLIPLLLAGIISILYWR